MFMNAYYIFFEEIHIIFKLLFKKLCNKIELKALIDDEYTDSIMWRSQVKENHVE